MSSLTHVVQSLIAFIGRICLSTIFLLAGYTKIITFDSTMAFMTQHAVPHPEILLVLAIILEVGCGLLLFLGLFTRFAGFMLFFFVIAATYFFHGFWGMDGAEMAAQMQHALKNFAMMGGLLYVLAFGAGSFSFDWLFRRKRHHVEHHHDE